MSRDNDCDLPYKLRLRTILFSQGYWTPIEVQLCEYEYTGISLKRQPLTDLDVLGIKYDHLFIPHIVVGDCKTGKNVQDVGRLFWIKGVSEYFGADLAYYVRPKFDLQTRTVAPKVGVRLVDDHELHELERNLNVQRFAPLGMGNVEAHQQAKTNWGIQPPPANQRPSDAELQIKSAFAFLDYDYWYLDKYRSLMSLVTKFEAVAPLLQANNPRHVLLVHAACERFVLTILDIASHIKAQGAKDVPSYTRTYVYGGPTALKEKEQFIGLLNRITNSRETLDPRWLNEVIELVGRFLRNPSAASDTLRNLSAAYIWCAQLGNNLLPSFDPAVDNNPSMAMAKDAVTTFSTVTGISREFYSWLALA